MDSESKNNDDRGFLFSLNLMVLGGCLLLFVIIAGNKLIHHYLYLSDPTIKAVFLPFSSSEGAVFNINNTPELYVIWFAFILSFIGFSWVMVKLVKTWKE